MQAHNYSIKDLPKDDRPREKLLSKNPMALSDSELLALLINTGTRDKSALDLAKDVLQLGKSNLGELGKLTIKKINDRQGNRNCQSDYHRGGTGIGKETTAVISLEKQIVSDSHAVARYLQGLLKDLNYEVFGVLFLNRANKINHFEIISRGGITATIADPRIILKRALEEDAVSLILCHNHPSGNIKPSRADEELTVKIREAAKYFDIRVLDHIIVADNGYFSFADSGIL